MRALAPALLLIATAASAQAQVDLAKAVDCATLSQQLADIMTAAKDMADDVKKAATETAGAGRKACMAKDYDAGMVQIREAIGRIGKKPIV